MEGRDIRFILSYLDKCLCFVQDLPVSAWILLLLSMLNWIRKQKWFGLEIEVVLQLS